MALIDDFLPALAFAAMLASEQNLADTACETARADMDRLLDQAMLKAGRENPGQAGNALFAVCAFADEVILASTWPGRHEWMRHKLQEVRFNTGNAGEEFYVRLAGLCGKSRQDQPEMIVADNLEQNGEEGQREALEVYVACLTLGFSGRYYDREGRARIDELTRTNLERLQGEGWALPDKLFPEAYNDSRLNFKHSRILPLFRLLLFLIPPTLLAIGVYATYDTLLSTFVTNWLQALNGGG
ncbi:MAG: DotU family type IV/VI secretion system protein [Pseudomonadota bacterium]